MPYAFSYNGNEVCGELQKIRCVKIKADNTRCKMETYIGAPYCWRHLRSDAKCKIAKSRIHGLGLYAYSPERQRERMPVFSGYMGHNKIMRYVAERVTEQELEDRYGDDVAPYGASHYSGVLYDAACLRGAAALANSLVISPALARRLGNNPTDAQLRRISVKTKMADGRYRNLKFNCVLASDDDDVIMLEAIREIYHGDELICYYGPDYGLEDPPGFDPRARTSVEPLVDVDLIPRANRCKAGNKDDKYRTSCTRRR